MLLMLPQPSPPLIIHQRMHDVFESPQSLLHVATLMSQARVLEAESPLVVQVKSSRMPDSP